MKVRSTCTDTYYLKRIMENLAPFLEYTCYSVNTRISINKTHNENCYFVKSGTVAQYRYPGKVLLDIFDAPTVRGYIPLPTDTEYVVKVLLPSEVAILPRDKFFNLLTAHNLWEDFSRYQMAIISSASEIVYRLSTDDIYHTIRYQLIELMAKSPEIRELITAENYIRSKTRISRSSIMRILSSLKAGGYISIDRGVLRGINNLPLEY